MSGRPSLLRRALLCPFGLCGRMVARRDAVEVWGECLRCGRRRGVRSRDEVEAGLSEDRRLSEEWRSCSED